MTPTRTCAAAILATALTLGGCGGGSSSSSSSGTSSAPATASSAAAPAQGPTTIAIANFAYAPASLTEKAGTKLTFVNHDTTAHTATATGAAAFDTGTVKAGGKATVTLTHPGTYSYICQFHPFMKGTVTVTG